MNMKFKRGDVVLVSLSPVIGSEQADLRPAVIVSYELFQRLKVVTVVALTSRIIDAPGRVLIQADKTNGLKISSDALAYQMRTISTDPRRIKKKLGKLSSEDVKRVDQAMRLVLVLK
jgi:mRNA interferase MazF